MRIERSTTQVGDGISAVARHPVVGPLVVAGAAAVACATIWFADPTTPGGIIPVCPTKALFGIDCPGCGTMRAIYSLMHGELTAAVQYNAVTVAAVVLLSISFVAYCVGLWRGRRVTSWQHHRHSTTLVLIVVVAWFVIRNIPVEPFQSLRV